MGPDADSSSPTLRRRVAYIFSFFPILRVQIVKDREKSALQGAVTAALAGVCERCADQIKWCVSKAIRYCCHCCCTQKSSAITLDEGASASIDKMSLRGCRKHKYGKFKLLGAPRKWCAHLHPGSGVACSSAAL